MFSGLPEILFVASLTAITVINHLLAWPGTNYDLDEMGSLPGNCIAGPSVFIAGRVGRLPRCVLCGLLLDFR